MSMNNKCKLERSKKLSYWQEHIKLWESSGLTASRYCKERGLSAHKFFYWRDQINIDTTKSSLLSEDFIELRTESQINIAKISESKGSRRDLYLTMPRGITIKIPCIDLGKDLAIIFKELV